MTINTLSSKTKITRQQQEEAEQQIREERKIIDYNTIAYPVEVVVQKFLEGQERGENELFIPNYNREMTWNEQQQSSFIESILLGLPIPSIYVADVFDESKDLARWELIDGSQRLVTLTRFLNNELTLNHLEKLDQLEGFNFSDLTLARQRLLKRTIMRIVQLTSELDQETRMNLCKRINGQSI